MPASARATRTLCWMAGPRMARRLAPPPLWMLVLPRTTARMMSPSAAASARARWHTAAAPSPRSKPSAEASNVLQRPSLGNMLRAVCRSVRAGCRMRLTPPDRARTPAPRLRASLVARCVATRADAEAVSTLRLGPTSPRVWLTRFAAKAYVLYAMRPTLSATSLTLRPDSIMAMASPRRMASKSLLQMPMMAAVLELRIPLRSRPPRCSASAQACSSTRCWGSISAASAGETEK